MKNSYTSVPRALKRPCAKHRASAKAEVRETLQYNADSVLRNYFLGEGFAKSRLMFLKFGGDFEFCPCAGRVWEGIRATQKYKYKIL